MPRKSKSNNRKSYEACERLTLYRQKVPAAHAGVVESGRASGEWPTGLFSRLDREAKDDGFTAGINRKQRRLAFTGELAPGARRGATQPVGSRLVDSVPYLQAVTDQRNNACIPIYLHELTDIVRERLGLHRASKSQWQKHRTTAPEHGISYLLASSHPADGTHTRASSAVTTLHV